MHGVCFSTQPGHRIQNLLGLQNRFLARIGPGNGPDKTSDLRTAICLRPYEVIMVLYKAKFKCKQTITFARSIRNFISGSSAMLGCNYSATSWLNIWERVAIDARDVIVFKSIRFRVSTLIRYVPYLLVWAPRRSLNFQSFRCGVHSGAALNRGRRSLKNLLLVNYNKNF